MDELMDILSMLEITDYRLSEGKSELYKTEIEWIGHQVDQKGIRPLQDELFAIKDLKEPKKN